MAEETESAFLTRYEFRVPPGSCRRECVFFVLSTKPLSDTQAELEIGWGFNPGDFDDCLLQQQPLNFEIF